MRKVSEQVPLQERNNPGHLFIYCFTAQARRAVNEVAAESRWIFQDNFANFSIKTYAVGYHKSIFARCF